jgi:hypothetical protein
MHLIKPGLRHKDLEGIHLPSFKFSWKLKKLDLSNNMHDVTEIPRWHWRNRGNLYTTYVVSDILYCPGYHGAIARLHGPAILLFLLFRPWWCDICVDPTSGIFSYWFVWFQKNHSPRYKPCTIPNVPGVSIQRWTGDIRVSYWTARWYYANKWSIWGKNVLRGTVKFVPL